MPITTLSSREFNQDTGGAKKASKDGPVFITHRGKASHVLLTIEDYQRLVDTQKSLGEMLAMPGDAAAEALAEPIEVPQRVVSLPKTTDLGEDVAEEMVAAKENPAVDLTVTWDDSVGAFDAADEPVEVLAEANDDSDTFVIVRKDGPAKNVTVAPIESPPELFAVPGESLAELLAMLDQNPEKILGVASKPVAKAPAMAAEDDVAEWMVMPGGDGFQLEIPVRCELVREVDLS